MTATITAREIWRIAISMFLTLGLPLLSSSQITVTPASSDCSCDGSLSYASTQGINAYFSWSDNSGNLILEEITMDGESSINGLCPGVYWLEVNSGNDEEIFFFSVPGTSNPGMASSDTLCNSAGDFNLSELLVGYVPGGVWTDSNGQTVNNDQNTANLTGTEVFYYTTYSGSCPVSTLLEVTIVQNASAGLSTTYLICENYEPFLMTDVLTGNPSESGVWLNSNGVALDGFYHPETMNGGLFTYMVDVIAYCDPAFSSLFIIENVIGNPGEDADALICSNAGVVDLYSILEGSPEPGGYWLNELGQPVGSALIPAPGLDGTYTYVLPGETPCPAQSAQVDITFTAFNPAGVGNSIEVCENHPQIDLFSLLEGNPFNDGLWYSPDGSPVSSVIEPFSDQTGEYLYLVQDGNCPIDSASIDILIDELPNAGQDVAATLCATVLSNLDELPSTGVTSGSWYTSGAMITDPSNVFVPSGLSTILYIAQSENNVCPADTAIYTIIGEMAPPSLTDLDISLCASISTVNLNELTGISGNAFWSTDGTSIEANLDISEPSEWQLTVIQNSGNSCPDDSATVTLHVTGEYFPQEAYSAEICDDGEPIDLFELTSTELSSGIWYTGDGDIIDDGILGSVSNGTYLLISPEEYICGPDTLFTTVVAYSSLNAGPDSQVTVCENSAPFQWADVVQSDSYQVFFNGLETTDLFDPATMPAGNYEVITATQGLCPADTAWISVNILPAMTFDAGPDVEICEGEAPFQIGQPAEDGCTYQWVPSLNLNNNLVSNPEFSPSEVALSPWTQEYVVIVSNDYCSTSDSISVTINPGAQAELIAPESSCSGTSINASVSGNLTTWAWDVNGVAVQENGSLSLNPESTINIEVSGMNEWGCQASDWSVVVVSDYPQVLINNIPDPSCSPIQLDLYADIIGEGDVDINWFINGEMAGSGEQLNSAWYGEGEQDLLVSIENDYGCLTEISLEDAIVVYPAPSAQIDASSLVADIFQPAITFTDISEEADERLWTLPDGSNTDNQSFVYNFDPIMEGNNLFFLQVWNNFGCSDTSYVIIRTIEEQVFYAPNSFTPDNDGVNEIFLPVFAGYDKESYSLSIYDRWGIKIFETSDPGTGWKGDNLGGEYYVQQDVYVWKVTLRLAGKADYDTFTGSVTILR